MINRSIKINIALATVIGMLVILLTYNSASNTILVIVASLMFAGTFIYSVSNLFNFSVNAFTLNIIGFSVFGFLDVIKYCIMEYKFKQIDTSTQNIVFIFICVSLCVFLIVYHLGILNTSKIRRAVANVSLYRFDVLLTPIMMLLLVLYNIYPDYQRNAYFAVIGYALKAYFILTAYIYIKFKKPIHLVFMVLIFALSINDSSRRALLILIIPIIMLLVDDFKSNNVVVTVKHKIIIMVAVCFSFIYLNYMRAGHDYGAGYIEGDKITNTVQYIKTLKSIDTFYNTCFIYDNFPGKFNYYFGSTYLSIPVGIIPRSMWEGKPVGLAAPLGLMQRTGRQDFSFDAWREIMQFTLSPGLVGEAYANWGFFGIILVSACIGIFTRIYDNSIVGGNYFAGDLPLLTLSTSFLLVHRGDFYSAVMYSVFMFIFLYAFVKFIKE